MLWYSGCNHSVKPYFEIYIEYKPLEKRDNTEVNEIGGIIKPRGICTIVMNLEDYTGKLQNLNFEQV